MRLENVATYHGRPPAQAPCADVGCRGYWLAVLEPLPKGRVLLSLTSSHGVDAGDLPALALLVAISLVI
jgi:hypothetical protein